MAMNVWRQKIIGDGKDVEFNHIVGLTCSLDATTINPHNRNSTSRDMQCRNTRRKHF